ncbi:MAG: DUF4389 domain-containing protein [Gammaproteobacteria bacterium]|nr:DUF4389 domain-containing protein [Gammaproteobacteria bacterium]
MTEQNAPAEDAIDNGSQRGRRIEENLKSRATWTRLLFMLICYVLVSIASFVGTFAVVFGFLWLLFSGEVNRQMQQLGQSLASYIYQIIRYLTFNSDERPYPLGADWPSGTASPK